MEPPKPKPKAKAKAKKTKTKAEANKKKSNLRVAIMLGIPLAPMNLKQNPSQLSPESVPHKGGKHW
jgi:hypothetical protein